MLRYSAYQKKRLEQERDHAKPSMKSWITQASRDEGVDGVAINEDPIVGGLCIVEAKRYSKIVGLEAVHALLPK